MEAAKSNQSDQHFLYWVQMMEHGLEHIVIWTDLRETEANLFESKKFKNH